MVIYYRRFGTTYRSRIRGSRFPKENLSSSQLLRGGSRKSRDKNALKRKRLIIHVQTLFVASFSIFRYLLCSLRYDRSIASSKASCPQSAIWCFLFPILVSSLFSLRSSSRCLPLLPRLPVISIIPPIFPWISCLRRQFLRRMWPIKGSSSRYQSLRKLGWSQSCSGLLHIRSASLSEREYSITPACSLVTTLAVLSQVYIHNTCRHWLQLWSRSINNSLDYADVDYICKVHKEGVSGRQRWKSVLVSSLKIHYIFTNPCLFLVCMRVRTC